MTSLPWSPRRFISLHMTACLLYRPVKCRDQEKLQRDLYICVTRMGRSMEDVFQPLESPERVQAEIKKTLEFEYIYKGETLENISSTLYLGVCLSELKWEAHINKITSKTTSSKIHSGLPSEEPESMCP